MIATGLITIVFIIGIIMVLAVSLVWNNRKGNGLKLADVGSILDQAIWAYRQHFVMILSLSTICVFLGSISGYAMPLLGITSTFTVMNGSSGLDLYPLLMMLVSLLSMLGIGRTLLAYGAARAVWMSKTNRVASVGSLFRHQPPGKLLGLLAFMIIPSIITSFMSIIGVLPALLWALTPATMVFESVGPYEAFQRSYRLIWKNFGALLHTLVPLWLIGLLVNASLLAGSITAFNMLTLPPELITSMMLLAFMLSNIITAPLTAFGAVSFYQYVHERLPVPTITA